MKAIPVLDIRKVVVCDELPLSTKGFIVLQHEERMMPKDKKPENGKKDKDDNSAYVDTKLEPRTLGTGLASMAAKMLTDRQKKIDEAAGF